MSSSRTFICYLLFFLSGAAALIYQVVWLRSLTLVFGGSHAAVSAVLSIFMGGLALGGYLIGKWADSATKPLRLYGFLELGIALSALGAMALMNVYPSVYVFLAQGRDASYVELFLTRALLATAALIVPTTLMGGTLPVLTQFVARQPEQVRGRLSLLYAVNTLGAVVGAVGTGFFLLRNYSLSVTTYGAVVLNLLVGLVSILLQPRSTPPPQEDSKRAVGTAAAPSRQKKLVKKGHAAIPSEAAGSASSAAAVAFWGIGISGFCALGYEVLWTRVLSIVVGATVYSFTTMLAAFLTGIALGGALQGLGRGSRDSELRGVTRSVFWFGVVQLLIGISALVASARMVDLPGDVLRATALLQAWGMDPFGVRSWGGFFLAFLYMGLPALFMGAAFPLAGTIYSHCKLRVGSAVGATLASNTVGAILGAAATGFVLVPAVGIERSLQILIGVNLALGLFVIASVRYGKRLSLPIVGLAAAALAFLVVDRTHLRLWSVNYFGFYSSTNPEEYASAERRRWMVSGFDLLYYGEGAEAVVSSFKDRSGLQYFMTNGRTEASTGLDDQQLQLLLGHLPVLVNDNPKKVLVVGLGSGMTLGATSVHPSVEQVTLVEIEPKVLGVARTFGEYNHHVLDNPKLKVVFNDGRNFLMTSKDTYDVITADPIHPWFRGTGYLYSSEYFRLAAAHLAPGGVFAQWIPLYDLAPADIACIVKTFVGEFRHAMLWVTASDAELIGSNSPIILDEAAMAKKMSHPDVRADLERIGMGSTAAFLSYFVAGTAGLAELARQGVVNTDDNLYLEFASPLSFATQMRSTGANLRELFRSRESILPYLAPKPDLGATVERTELWERSERAAGRTDPIRVELFLHEGTFDDFVRNLQQLDAEYPWYAPATYMKRRFMESMSGFRGSQAGSPQR